MSVRPIDPAEAAARFDPLLARPLALAVSGGPDSMALLHLVAAWASEREAGEILVITVDHGLRPGSGAEAAFVASEAQRLGLPHVTLTWDGAKPETGIQETARLARYALIAKLLAGRPGGCRPWTLATAHHEDDQAETLLMRLARGSGVDGLAGMAPRVLLEIVPGHPIALVRPFLDVPKERLFATLAARGVRWCNDPSNEAVQFERVRIRQAMPQLLPLGLGSAALARSAARLARARDALDRTTDRLACGIVDDHAGGYATCDLAALLDAPQDISIRLLRRLIVAFGAPGGGRELAQIETLHQWLTRGVAGGTQSLGGALVEIGRRPSSRAADGNGRSSSTLFVYREPGRDGLPSIEIAPGCSQVWDGRIHVAVSAELEQPVTIGPLGAAEWADLKHACPRLADTGLPHRAAATLPTLRQDDRLLAVPGLAAIEPRLAVPLTAGIPQVRLDFVWRRSLYGQESSLETLR